MQAMWATFVAFAGTVFVIHAAAEHDDGTQSNIIQLSQGNWSLILDGHWMVEFFAPWCPACKALQKHWEELATSSEDLNVKVAQIDITKSPGLSGRFLIFSLPTIYHVRDGEFRLYNKGRSGVSLIKFIKDDEWNSIDSIPWYKSPSSIPLAVLSQMFIISMRIREAQEHLSSVWKFPSWLVYALLGLSSLVLGLLFGLVLIFLFDCCCSSRRKRRLSLNKDDDMDKDEITDNGDDDEAERKDDTGLPSMDEADVTEGSELRQRPATKQTDDDGS